MAEIITKDVLDLSKLSTLTEQGNIAAVVYNIDHGEPFGLKVSSLIQMDNSIAENTASLALTDASLALKADKSDLNGKVNTTDIEQVRSQATNKVASSKLLDDELTALDNAVDEISINNIKGWAISESFSVSNPTFDGFGNISGGAITWADGDIGTISNVTAGFNGITSIRYNRSDGKYATVTITYNASGVVSNQEVILTGF